MMCLDEIVARECAVHVECLSRDEVMLNVTVGDETRMYRFVIQDRTIKLWRYE